MKFIVYRTDAEASNGCPYQMTKLFEEETYKVFLERKFEYDGRKAIIPKPHIVIMHDDVQVNIVMGDFVEAFDGVDERKARILTAHLNEVNQVMDA